MACFTKGMEATRIRATSLCRDSLPPFPPSTKSTYGLLSSAPPTRCRWPPPISPRPGKLLPRRRVRWSPPPVLPAPPPPASTTNLLANLYIAPSGSTPGHFAQGVTGSTLDTSQALDASGHWAALWAHATNRDDIALQCAEFAYQNFLLTNQTIALSSAANSYNEAYQVSTPFSGMKPYNDSPGGYSGSPAFGVAGGHLGHDLDAPRPL